MHCFVGAKVEFGGYEVGGECGDPAQKTCYTPATHANPTRAFDDHYTDDEGTVHKLCAGSEQCCKGSVHNHDYGCKFPVMLSSYAPEETSHLRNVPGCTLVPLCADPIDDLPPPPWFKFTLIHHLGGQLKCTDLQPTSWLCMFFTML